MFWVTNQYYDDRDKLNPHHHHPRDKLTERKRYLSKSREAIFEKVPRIIKTFQKIVYFCQS